MYSRQRASLLFLAFTFYWNFSAFELLSSGASVLPSTGRACTGPSAPLPHSLKLLLPLFHLPILTARWQTSLNYNEPLPTHVCWLICFTQTQHTTSTVTAACFNDYKCERAATSWAHAPKIAVSVVEEEWALYWDSCSLPCDTSLLPGLP